MRSLRRSLRRRLQRRKRLETDSTISIMCYCKIPAAMEDWILLLYIPHYYCITVIRIMTVGD